MPKRHKLIKLRHEYFLNDYISKVGNYSIDQFNSSLTTELWFDEYNYGKATLDAAGAGTKALVEKMRRKSFPQVTKDGENYRRLDFSIIPDFGFLASSDPLAKNVELKLCFDRANAKQAIIDYESQANDEHKLLDNPWVIQDCYSIAEYISSPDLRQHYETIESSPLMYEFDDSEVLIRPLSPGETSIRIDAIHGGPIPSHLFAGIISTDQLAGSKDHTCTGFEQNNVKEFNININGHSVNGYPVKCFDGASTFPLAKWLESTNRLHNNLAGNSLNLYRFKENFIWSHHFETEETANGWISLDIKLTEAYKKNMSLVIWVIFPCTLTLDKYNQIERLKV